MSGGIDDRYGDPIGLEQMIGITVALKALIVRAGGRVELTGEELENARNLTACIDATPELLLVQLVEGAPPDVPRFAADE